MTLFSLAFFVIWASSVSTKNGSLNQKWEFNRIGGTDARGIITEIRSQHSYKCLENFNANAGEMNPIIQFKCDKTRVNQHWIVVKSRENNGIMLKNVGSQKCLSVYGIYDGEPALQSTCSDSEYQQWILEEDGLLKSKKSGKCIDIPRGNADDRIILQIWPCY